MPKLLPVPASEQTRRVNAVADLHYVPMSNAPLILYTDYGRLGYRQAWQRQQYIHDILVGWKREAVSEKREAVPERREAVSEKREAVPEKREAVSEKRDAMPEKREAVSVNRVAAPAGALLFVEHKHVYTMGKSGSWQNLVFTKQVLAEKGIEMVQTDRGGDITYHGPGQLVGYPVLDLERFGMGVAAYIDALEQVIIEVAAHFGVHGRRVKGRTGVWSGNNKICALGIKCSRYVSMHGFALNVHTDLEYFNGIVPCGLQDGGVTSLQKEAVAARGSSEGRHIELAQVAEQVCLSFARVFGAELQPASDHNELLNKLLRAEGVVSHNTHPPE